MSEHTVSDLCRAVLEHDERATKGPWDSAGSDTRDGCFSFATGPWHSNVGGNSPNPDLDAALIAHYRSACPTIAREYLRLAERLALAEAVCEGVAMYATIETDERLLMLHHKWLIAKDPQGEGA